MPYKDKEKAKEYYRKYYWERGGKERDSARHKIYYKNNREKILSKQYGGCDLDCENCKYDDCINGKLRVYTPRSEMTVEEREKTRVYHREYMRKKRVDAKAKGICTRCFKKPKMENRLYCYECHIWSKRCYRQYSKHEKRSEWQEKGLCTICGNERYEDKKVCKECYEILCENIQKARSHPEVVRNRERLKKLLYGDKMKKEWKKDDKSGN